MSNFNDVRQFHQKFGLLDSDKPRKLTQRKLKERLEFLFEEFTEFAAGCGFIITTDGFPINHPDEALRGSLEFLPVDKQDVGEQADALIDLVYVAQGTASMLGLPWEELWTDVHRANMTKVRGETQRGHKVDVCKPCGWEGPRTLDILKRNGFDNNCQEVDDE